MNRSKNPMLIFIRGNLLVAVVVASALWTGCGAGKIEGKIAFAPKIRS